MRTSIQSNDLLDDHFRKLGEDLVDRAVAGLYTMPIPQFATAVRVLSRARTRGSRLYVLGNGGSASTATHLVCDLVKTARRASERTLRAFALADNNAMLTAYANDVNYTDVFARQLADNAEPGDVVVAISASGCSPNVLAALRMARQMDLTSIGLLGCGGGPAADLVDHPIIIDSADFGVIETAHLAIVHGLTAAMAAPDPDFAVNTSADIPAKER
jgi:D-sedoheptulose 7-phosphate isomerase